MEHDENNSRIFSQTRQEAVKGVSKGEWIATRTTAGAFHNP
jgi:hypothetical protein